MHGHQVSVDCGFDIAEELALQGTTLAIPPYTREKQQLSQCEVEKLRSLLRVQIHVECGIGKIKNYKILKPILFQ